MLSPARSPRSPRSNRAPPIDRSPRSFLPPPEQKPALNLTHRPDLQTVTTSSLGWAGAGSPYVALRREYVAPLPNVLPPPRISPRGWGVRTPRDGEVGYRPNRWNDEYAAPKDKLGNAKLSPRHADVRQWLRSKNTQFERSYKAWTTPDVIFDVIDSDKSGQISIAELSRFFSNSPMDGGKLEELFSSIDDDGSGEISRQEWMQGFHRAGFDGSSIVGQSSEGVSILLSLVTPPRESGNVAELLDAARHHPPTDLPMSHRRVAKAWQPVLRVANPAERGITLVHLRRLWAHVQRRCDHEGWMDVNGEPLETSTVTMYDVVRCTLALTLALALTVRRTLTRTLAVTLALTLAMALRWP
jgi:hypothetical protein